MLARLDQPEADHGPRKNAAGTTRLCIATREVKPIEQMIRFVLAPDGTVVPDLKRKLPGRGVWVTARQSVLAEATQRGAFRRGFKCDATVSKDRPVLVERLLERAVLDSLAIAHKAGDVVTGFAKVEAAIAADRIAALLHGKDASAEGWRKIAAALKRRFGEDTENIVTIATFTSAQLDLALGRTNVVHAALLAGRASDSVLARWLLLHRFRMGDPDGEASPKLDTKPLDTKPLDTISLDTDAQNPGME
jgi:predicted RNA-binding protein YlxR (DUF448 family)